MNESDRLREETAEATVKSAPPTQTTAAVRSRVRVRYHKGGDLRLLSHHDMLRLLERLFRRAGLDLAMSQGFHPKPKMSFPLALGLGIEGCREIMELELTSIHPNHELLQLLNQHAPEGLTFTSVLTAPNGKAQVHKTEYAIQVPEERLDEIRQAIESFLDADQWLVERQRKIKKKGKRRGHASSRGSSATKTVNLRAGVERLWLEENQLYMSLLEVREAGVRPRDVLEILQVSDIERTGEMLIRTNVILSDESPQTRPATNAAPAVRGD